MALLEVTTATFSHQVLEADKPVLVDFWGPRCQPCLALMPVVEALAQEHARDLIVVKVNANARENWQLCREQNVSGLPSYLFFQKGKEVRRIAGAEITRQLLADAIHELLTLTMPD